MTTLISHRANPWEKKAKTLLPLPENLQESSRDDQAPAPRVFVLEGRYLYDPERVTTADVRSFLFASLRLLRSEAERQGLAEADVNKLVTAGFDTLHEAADCLWEAMRKVVTAAPGGASTPPATGAAAASSGESPEHAELRRLSIRREIQAAYNRDRHDEEASSDDQDLVPDTDVPMTVEEMARAFDRLGTPMTEEEPELPFDPDDYPLY